MRRLENVSKPDFALQQARWIGELHVYGLIESAPEALRKIAQENE